VTGTATTPRWLTASRVICLALLVVFTTVLVMGSRYPRDAGLFPTIAGSTGLLLTLLLLLVDRPAAPSALHDHAPTSRGRTAIALLAAPVFSVLVWLAGFYVAAFLALAVLPWLLGYRRPLVLLAVAIGGVAVLAGLFAGAMDMLLPQGLLGEWFLYRFVYDR
jgi:hypothetical protein